MNQRPKTRNPIFISDSSPPSLLHSSSSIASASTSRLPNLKSIIQNTRMGRKSFIKPTLSLAVILSLLLLYVFFNTFMYPNPSKHEPLAESLLLSRENVGGSRPPVKVYMYDLPRKFTYGVIESYALARGAPKVNDDSLLKYPGNQHPAEWYLFADLTRTRRPDSPVTRVLDPEEADLFYVPFFSSLSLVVNPIRPSTVSANLDRPIYSDEETQESLIDWLEEQTHWKRNNGWDHVFIAQDPNALYKIVDWVKNGVLLVSDFGRLASNQASLVKDVIVPYSHRINSYNGDVGLENRKSLLFFMGNRYRKEGGKIRDLLFQLLEKEEDIIIKHGAQSRESRRVATQGMHTSKFCLHPAGDTPSACRLFDAIVSLCVPVIISDYIELPFEDTIDYRKIAIFVDSNSAVKPGYLVKLLRKVSMKKILEFQLELKKVKQYFEYEDPNGTVNEIWRQVSLKFPLIKLMINRDKRLVKRDLTEPQCSCICTNETGHYTTL